MALYSGGAEGADKAFSLAAYKAGHSITHLSFEGHKIHHSVKGQIKILNQEELDKAWPELMIISKKINRYIGRCNSYVLNLLKRNYYQIHMSDDQIIDSMYAVVTHFDSKQTVPGGTSWAINLYIHLGGFPYLFVENTRHWFQWEDDMWVDLGDNLPPIPSGNYAGIGSRNITNIGLKAIEDLYKE